MSILEMNRFTKLGQPLNKLIPEMELKQISQDSELGQLKNIPMVKFPSIKIFGGNSTMDSSKFEFEQNLLLRSVDNLVNLLDEGVVSDMTEKYNLHYIEEILKFKKN